MLRTKNILSLLVLLTALNLSANGLMMPTEESYPKDFLRKHGY